MNKIDKIFCMSHYMAFRFVKDENINFFKGLKHKTYHPKNNNELYKIYTIDDIEKTIKEQIRNFYIPNKTALLLSGGIDSAILASYLPEKTKVFTFKCIADGSIDETEQASKYAKQYNLEHEIIEMYWEDFEELTPEILKYNQAPFHSIEVQLVKASKIAKKQGIEKIIVGDGADYVFGGMDKLLSKDWDFDSFIKRYNSIEPSFILKQYIDVVDVYEPYKLPNNKIDFLAFMKDIMDVESYTSYMHAFEKENIDYLDPYSLMTMANPLNLERIRNGEPKYLIRELFAKRYPNIKIPTKIPMPRSTEQWLKNYKPIRDEFITHNIEKLTGDQKWLVYCLETFLNMHDKGEL
ncbi:TPA: asparagine synthase [Campylobacter coli]|nr:asparagine synthase [Campylobacter coli]EAI2879358.1 asparagine synthase [Campylobacter jejuni]EAH8345164.1 asparagine synthase [Campylobacter coli]EAI5930524.1 asparagine synthase [Campylobacter coli]EAI7228380.1 asparagine synthase [Campylobacter coli]